MEWLRSTMTTGEAVAWLAIVLCMTVLAAHMILAFDSSDDDD